MKRSFVYVIFCLLFLTLISPTSAQQQTSQQAQPLKQEVPAIDAKMTEDAACRGKKRKAPDASESGAFPQPILSQHQEDHGFTRG